MPEKWTVEFYEDAQGRRPVEKWIDGLSDQKAEAILLRVFVAFEREKLIVLLGAYDKGKNDKQGFQQAQIEIARKRLKDWKRRGT
jgi:hypothetical protein